MSRLRKNPHYFILFLLSLPICGYGQLYEFKQLQKWGLMDRQAKVVVAADYDEIEPTLYRYYFYLKKGPKIGLYHRNQGWVVPPNYDHIFPPKGGYFIIAEAGKYGLMDSVGKVILPPLYDQLIQEGHYFYFYLKKKMGLFSPSKGEILPAHYDHISRYDSTYFVIKEKRLMGLVDTLGQKIEPTDFQDITHIYEDIYAYKQGGKWGAKQLGASVCRIPMEFDRIKAFDRGGICIQAAQKGQSSLWSISGDLLLDSIQGELIQFLGDVYIYKYRGEFGLLDRLGISIVPANYSSIKPYGEAHLGVELNHRLGVMDHTGKIIIPIDYSRIFRDSTGRFWVRKANKWGVFDTDGTEIFAPTFIKPSTFQFGVAIVSMYDNGFIRRGLINASGEYLADPKYEAIKVYPSFARLKLNKEITQLGFDSKGKRSNRMHMIVDVSPRAYNRRVKEKIRAMRSQVAETDSFRIKFHWELANGKWGLRDNDPELPQWQIEPRFDAVDSVATTSMSLVSLRDARSGKIRYGLVNHERGKLLHKPKFSFIFIQDFQTHDYARAQLSNGFFTILNKKGKAILPVKAKYWNRYYRKHKILQPPIYIGKFDNGRARALFGEPPLSPDMLTDPRLEVKLTNTKGSWGIISPYGKFHLYPTYDYLSDIQDGVLCFNRGGFWGLMSGQYATISSPIYARITDPGPQLNLLITEMAADKVSLLDKDGSYVLSLILDKRDTVLNKIDISKVGDFRENLLLLRSHGKWGYAKPDGSFAIEPIYGRAKGFFEGLARIESVGKWGYIDREGHKSIKPQYQKAEDFHEGLAGVSKGRHWQYIDQTGRRAIRGKFLKAGNFNQGLAIVRNRRGKWGIIDQVGNWKLKPLYRSIQYENGFIKVENQHGVNYYHQDLSPLFRQHYLSLGKPQEGKVRIKTQKGFGFMDLNEEVIIKPKYQNAGDFSSGLAPVQWNDKWGYIDESEIMQIPANYHWAGSFVKGAAVVAIRSQNKEKSLRWGIINPAGKLIVPRIYTRIQQTADGLLACRHPKGYWEYFDAYGIGFLRRKSSLAGNFRDGMTTHTVGGKTYLINSSGRYVVNPPYDKIEGWQGTHIIARSTRRHGLIDRKGNEILAPIYDQVQYVDGLFRIINNSQVGYMTEEGKWIWPLRE